jgi:hypothetical protein
LVVLPLLILVCYVIAKDVLPEVEASIEDPVLESELAEGATV